jgi:tetratricopeptide (TPR) repeat protein
LGALPDDFKAHLGMVACYEELQQIPRAVWHLERAFELDPNNKDLQAELRRLYERNRQQPPVRFQLSRAALARIYFSGKLFEQAIGELQAALPQFPDRYDLQILYADALWNAEYVSEATEQSLVVLETLPDALLPNRIMAQLWLRANRPSDARPYFFKVEQLDPFAAWELTHPDGAEFPKDALKLPRLLWDVRAAAALATNAPEWMASIGEVFENLDDAEQQIAPNQRRKVWLDDLNAPGAGGAGAPIPGQRAGLLERFGQQQAGLVPSEPEEDEAPNWFREFEEEAKVAKRKTSTQAVSPVWVDDGGDGSPLSVGAPDLLADGPTFGDDQFTFDFETPSPSPLSPSSGGSSRLESAAADALQWIQAGDDAVGLDPAQAGIADADWLLDDDSSPAIVPAEEALSWLKSDSLPTPPSASTEAVLPPLDSVIDSGTADALAWLQTGGLSPDDLPAEFEGTVPPADLADQIGDEAYEPGLVMADDAMLNSPSDALAWLQTGALSPDKLPAHMPMDADASVAPVDAPHALDAEVELEGASLDWFGDADKGADAEVVAIAPATPDSAPELAGGDVPDWMQNFLPDVGVSADAAPVATPPPAAGESLVDEFSAWLSESAEATVEGHPPASVPSPMTAPKGQGTAEVDEFALMFDDLSAESPASPAAVLTSPEAAVTDEISDPVGWAKDLGLDFVAEPEQIPSDTFEPLGQDQQDPLAWIKEAGLPIPAELLASPTDAADVSLDEAAQPLLQPEDPLAWMRAAGIEVPQFEEAGDIGLDIQSDLEINVAQWIEGETAESLPPIVAAAPAPEPEARLGLVGAVLEDSDPAWLLDLPPVEAPTLPADEMAGANVVGATPSAPDFLNEGLDWLNAIGDAPAADLTPTPSVAAPASPAPAPQFADDLADKFSDDFFDNLGASSMATEATPATAAQGGDLSFDWLEPSAVDQVMDLGSAAFKLPDLAAATPPPAADFAAPAAELGLGTDDFSDFLSVLTPAEDAPVPPVAPVASSAKPTKTEPAAGFDDWLTGFGADDAPLNDEPAQASASPLALDALDFNALTPAQPFDKAPDLSGLLSDLGVQPPVEAAAGGVGEFSAEFTLDNLLAQTPAEPTVGSGEFSDFLSGLTAEASSMKRPAPAQPQPPVVDEADAAETPAWLRDFGVADAPTELPLETTPPRAAQPRPPSEKLPLRAALPPKLKTTTYTGDDLGDMFADATPAEATPAAPAPRPAAQANPSAPEADWLSDFTTEPPLEVESLDLDSFFNEPAATPAQPTPSAELESNSMDINALLNELKAGAIPLPSSTAPLGAILNEARPAADEDDDSWLNEGQPSMSPPAPGGTAMLSPETVDDWSRAAGAQALAADGDDWLQQFTTSEEVALPVAGEPEAAASLTTSSLPSMDDLFADMSLDALTGADQAAGAAPTGAAAEAPIADDWFDTLEPPREESPTWLKKVMGDVPPSVTSETATSASPTPAPPSELRPDRSYNAGTLAGSAGSVNTSEQPAASTQSSTFALGKKPRWSRTGKLGASGQTGQLPSVPTQPTPSAPAQPASTEKTTSPDSDGDDFSNLLNNLLSGTDSDVPDWLKK